MAGNIKGLTVEIGGDTTKLGKALENVNKKSRDLSSELGQVNKLLRMDPGNTELVAQKQKILADAIENTKSKLETLKRAEQQVQEQFARGEISEAQYRELQREIVATEQKLKGYENAAQQVADGNDKIAESAEEAADSSSGLGEALARAAEVGLKAVAAAVGAAVTGLVGAAEATRDYRMEMGKLETAFTTQGFTAEQATAAYTDLVGVLGETDQAVEATNHLAQLTDNEKDLATWTGDILPGVFATFGDSLPIEGLTEAANETAKLGQVTGPLADALNWAGVNEDEFNEKLAACSDEQERQALITETLAGLYGEASEKYKEMNEEVIRANQANDAWMKSLAGIGGAIEPILTDVKLMGAELLTSLVPGVEKAAEAFRGILNGDAGAAGDFGASLTGVITDVLGMVTDLAPVVVEVATSIVTSLITTLTSMLPQLVSTGLTLFTTLLEGLAQAIPQITQAITNMIPSLVLTLAAGVPMLVQGAVQLFMALVEAIPQILPPLIAAIPPMISMIVQALVSQVPVLLQGAVQLLMAIVQAIPQIVTAIVPQIPVIVEAIVAALVQSIPVLLAGAVQLLMAIIDAIPTIIKQLAGAVPKIVAAIVKGLLNGLGSIGQTALKLGKTLLDNVVNGVKDLPAKVWSAIVSAIDKVQAWGAQMVAKAAEAAGNMVSSVVNFVTQLPSKIWSAISGAITNVATWGSQLASKAASAASSMVSAVVNGLAGLPGKVLSIGGDLVKGLWNGVNNKLAWLKGKIKSFTKSVLKSIKDFFGVHSPARSRGALKTTDWVGEMLNEGLAVGLIDSTSKPVAAMQKVTGSVLDAAKTNINGLTLSRQIEGNFGGSGSDLGSKLDKILAAIESGQILTIDGDALVGATATRLDKKLGQRRALAARGAI